MKHNLVVIKSLCIRKLSEKHSEKINEKLLQRIIKKLSSLHRDTQGLVDAVCNKYLESIGKSVKIGAPEKKKSVWDADLLKDGRKHFLDFSRKW